MLFLPGQAGSYRQVRSFGTAAFKLETHDSNKDVIDWFTIDFGDEWSGLSGIILERQAAFAARCVERILALYEHVPSDRRPRAVPLVGHSMGGVVARAVAALPAMLERQSVGTVLALHSPLTPAAVSHESVARFYASIETAWCDPANARALDGVALLSLGGGLRDSLVRSDLSAVPQRPCAHNVSYATVLPSIEGIQRSADHQCGVWCLEVAERVAQAFRRLTPLIDAPEDAKQRLVLLKQHLGASFRVLLRDGAALATTSTGSSGSQVVHAPATLKTNDVVTVSATSNDGGDNAWSHWVLLSTSPAARFVGRELPLLLTARDGLYVNGAPRLSVVPKLGAEILVRGATAGTTLVFTAQLAPAVEPIQFSLWRMVIDVASLVVRIDIDHVPRGVALVARVESRAGCSSRFVPRAIWCNDRCEATPSLPLIEDYFVGLDESSASAVRFFGSTDRLSLFAVTDTECVERIALHIDWMATVGHLLRIHWQLLYTLTVVVALANASLAWLLGGGGGDNRFARVAITIAVIGTTALVQSSIEQLGVAVVAVGTAAIVHDWLVRRLLQPLLRLVGWIVLLLFARRESVALVVVALVGFFDSAAALVLGMAVLAAASKSRDSATHVIALGLLVFPILATSTVVRIHAFTEHIEQAASGATYRGVLGILLPQFFVWPGIVELQPRAARLLLCVVGTLLAVVALVRQPSLAELIDGVILYAVVGSILHAIAVWMAQSDEKAKRL